MITTANYGAAVASFTSSSFGMAEVRKARLELTKAKAPQNDRSLFLEPEAYDALLSDSTNILANLNFGSEGVREGLVRRLAGLNVYESTLIPATNVGTSITLAGFAVHPSAIAVAVRTLQPQAPSEYLEARTVIDPVSGIGLGYRRHYNTANGTHYLNMEIVAGFTYGITAGLKILAKKAYRLVLVRVFSRPPAWPGVLLLVKLTGPPWPHGHTELLGVGRYHGE